MTPVSRNISKITLVTNTAVNMLIRRPAIKTIAKPFTGPVPTAYKMSAVINVVIFESTIVVKALSYPFLTASFIVLPLSFSSLIRSKINTFASTAIPIINTRPAIPGRVSVAFSIAKVATTRNMLKMKVAFATPPAPK